MSPWSGQLAKMPGFCFLSLCCKSLTRGLAYPASACVAFQQHFYFFSLAFLITLFFFLIFVFLFAVWIQSRAIGRAALELMHATTASGVNFESNAIVIHLRLRIDPWLEAIN